MEQKNANRLIIDISTKTIIKVLGVLLFLVFLYAVRDVVAIVLVSVIIVAAMSPLIEKFKKVKIPRSVSVLGIYIIFFGTIGLLASLIIPQLATQLKEVSKGVPQFVGKVNEVFGSIPQYEKISQGIETSLNNISDNLTSSATNFFVVIFKIFGGIATFFAILVLVFYMSAAEGEIKAFFKSLVPKDYEEKFHKIGDKVQKKIGSWVRGEAILMLTVGTLSFIGLKFLGIKYALTLAIIAGLLEIVPVIGPIISSIPAIIIGFTQSPVLGLAAAILYIVIQQSENHILVPKVMQKATGLSPVVVVISLLIGVRLLGFLGIILAVPVALILSVFVDELVPQRAKEE